MNLFSTNIYLYLFIGIQLRILSILYKLIQNCGIGGGLHIYVQGPQKRIGLLHVSPSKPSTIILFTCYQILTGLIDFVIPFPKVFIRVVPSLFQLINPRKLDFAFFFGKDRKVRYSIFVSQDIQCFDFFRSSNFQLVFQTFIQEDHLFGKVLQISFLA